MKILQVTPTFVPSNFGGVKAVSYNLSKHLVKIGCDVSVYTTDANIGNSRLKDTKGIRNIDGIEVTYFKNLSNLLAWKYRLFLPIGMILNVRKNLRSFDIIHLHDLRSLQAVLIHHFAREYTIPYVLHAHGSLATYFQKGSLKRIFDRMWGYRILHDAARLIAETSIEVAQYKNTGVNDDRIRIVPNGIDLAEFENLPARGEFRRRYGLNENHKIVLFLARINKIKGPDLLIKAFADLAENLDQVRLVIVGPDDGYLSTLEQLIKELKIEDKILFTGPLSGSDKLKAYVDADVYVLPSIYENFGVTVLEACACGTPVIVTDRCGIADIVVDSVAGLVVPYEEERLADAILRMLSDDKMRQEFSEHGRSLVREHFNWSEIARQVENLYQGIYT